MMNVRMLLMMFGFFWIGGLVIAAAAQAPSPSDASAPDQAGETSKTDGDEKPETATFGGGCFWCIEAVFDRIPGVVSAVSGYAGGTLQRPTYEQVCTGQTGHAEVVQVTFQPKLVSYETLLEVFWKAHDPTTLNRQGPDVGTQYRSIILYENAEQRQAASQAIERLRAQGVPVVTEIAPLTTFFPAESYHQNYFDRRRNTAYCQTMIAPKLRAMKLGTAPVPRAKTAEKK